MGDAAFRGVAVGRDTRHLCVQTFSHLTTLPIPVQTATAGSINLYDHFSSFNGYRDTQLQGLN